MKLAEGAGLRFERGRSPAVAGRGHAQLVDLQDRLLESNTLFIADELIRFICECLPDDASLLFYMRERRRFTDPNASDDPFLRFPYLSFEYECGVIKRFQKPFQLVEREKSVLEQNWQSLSSETTIIHWKPHAEVDEQTCALIRRVFLTFYHVCGVREHFIESISRRFIREFVKRNGKEFTNYARHFDELRRQFNIEAALGFQKDQFPKEASYLGDLIDVVPDSTPLLNLAADSPQFLNDLHSSISKKAVNYGYIEKIQVYYCINTLTNEHFVVGQNEEETEYRLARRAVLIFLSRAERLPLDGVHNATKLVDSALREQASVHREDPFFKVLQDCQKAEEKLATEPCKTREQLDEIIRKLLIPFLGQVASPASLAERIAVRRYEVFARGLTLLAGTKLDPFAISELVSLDDRDAAATQAFRGDKAVWASHVQKFERSDGLPAPPRPPWANSIGSDEDAFHVRAIRVGGVLSGVVEFSSSRAGSLRTEDVYFQRIAGTCSEIIRRIELANDRAWLSRMSYVHAARHRIEAIIRDIQKSSGQQAEALRKLLSSYSVLEGLSVAAGARAPLERRIAEMQALFPSAPDQAGNELCRTIAATCEEYGASDLAYGLLYEVLDTLLSNSSHSPFRPEDVTVTALPSENGPATLEIIHRPRGALQPTKTLGQVCVSPIRDRRSSTFHFGLFLLAAQLRMIGGAAGPAPPSDDGLGNSSFGASFMIPLSAPSEG